MNDAGITGPLFISIGDSEKLNKFLELNPSVPRNQIFVDDYTFGAYKSVGFGSLRNTNKEDLKDIKMSAPALGGLGEWWKYLKSAVELSPIEKGKSGLPEGVTRLGGTFVVDGDDVIYQWNDKIPGDTPELDDVFQIAKEAASS